MDAQAPFTHKVDGGKQQGNGVNGPGATVFTNMPFPAQSLTIRSVFPDETIVFPFESPDPAIRRDLGACFDARGSANSTRY